MFYYGIFNDWWVACWWASMLILVGLGTCILASAVVENNKWSLHRIGATPEAGPLAASVVALTFILAGIHFFGVFDVVGWCYTNGLRWAVLYLAAGGLYALVKGIYRLRQHRAAVIEKLREAKVKHQEWLKSGDCSDSWEVYRESLPYAKPPDASEVSMWLVTTCMFWPADLLLSLFAEYIGEVFQFVFRRIKNAAQRLINWVWRNAADEV